MKKALVLLTMAFASMAMVSSAAEGDIVEWIVNGDFETGDLTGWDGTNDAAIINSATPIDGSYSATVTNNWLSQDGFGIVSNTPTVKFDFSMEDPGGAEDRGLQFNVGLYNIYARVVDGANLDDGFGDIEFYDGSAWVSVLTDVVEFGTSNALSITINGFGEDFDYDLVLNGVTNVGMSLIQAGTFDSLSYVGFRGTASAVAFTVDNVSVVGAEPPPPPPPAPEGLANGDFEADPFDLYWNNAGVAATSGLTGSGTAAELGASDSMMQDFMAEEIGPLEYQVDFMLSLADTGGSQRIRLRGDGNSGDIITLKMDSGGLYKYAGTWYNAVPGSYSAGVAYYVRVNVGDFNEDTIPEYSVGISTDGTNYTTSIDFGSFHGDGATPFETIRFEGGSGGGMTIDEVSVNDGTVEPPPPATPVTVAISVLDLTDEVEISWGATNQLFYTVEASSNLVLGAAGWNSITSNVPGVNGVITITEPITEDQLFYRVITEE